MNKLLSCIILSSALYQPCVHALAKDKQLHTGVSSIIGLTSQYYTEDIAKSYTICLSVGLTKELYDEYDYNGFDKNDLLADALGCSIGIFSGEVLSKYNISFTSKGNNVGLEYTSKF